MEKCKSYLSTLRSSLVNFIEMEAIRRVSVFRQEIERSYFEVKMLLFSKFLDGVEITD